MSDPAIADVSRRAFLLRREMPMPTVALTDRCLATSGIYCESCRDACDVGALRFAPQLGAVPQPFFEPDRCNQCGECVRVCPQDAIRVRPKTLSHG